MKISVALVIIALICGASFGGYLYYEDYQKEKAYQRQIAQERYEREEREARERHEREERERKRRLAEERRQQMYDYAEEGVEWIVKKSYGGGSAIDYDVDSWDYNDYKDEFKIKVSINWSGKNFGGYYACNGLFRVTDEKITWEPSWHNEKLDDYLSFRNAMGVAIGGVVVLGALSEASQ